jgi:hypothetical protein
MSGESGRSRYSNLVRIILYLSGNITAFQDSGYFFSAVFGCNLIRIITKGVGFFPSVTFFKKIPYSFLMSECYCKSQCIVVINVPGEDVNTILRVSPNDEAIRNGV